MGISLQFLIEFTGILKYSPIDLGGDGASDVRGFAAYLIVNELRRSSDLRPWANHLVTRVCDRMRLWIRRVK